MQMILGGRAQTRFEIRTTCLNTIAEELGITNILTPKWNIQVTYFSIAKDFRFLVGIVVIGKYGNVELW